MISKQERKEEILRGMKAHLSAAHDHMTVHDANCELTENVQYQLDKARELLSELETIEVPVETQK